MLHLVTGIVRGCWGVEGGIEGLRDEVGGLVEVHREGRDRY